MRDDQYIVWDKITYALKEKYGIDINHITGGRDSFRCWDIDNVCYQIRKIGKSYKVWKDTGIKITI
jgi:hypothetical protein